MTRFTFQQAQEGEGTPPRVMPITGPAAGVTRVLPPAMLVR